MKGQLPHQPMRISFVGQQIAFAMFMLVESSFKKESAIDI